MNSDYEDNLSLGYWSDAPLSSPDLPNAGLEPYIRFIEEPADYRYRYLKERYHGHIVGVNSPPTKKKDMCIFPKVKLFNFSGNAIVRVWLLTTDLSGKPKAHFHKLARKLPKGALKLEPHDFLASEQNHYEVTLDYLHIVHAVSNDENDINIYRKKKAHIESDLYQIPQKTPSPCMDEKEEIKQIDKNQSIFYIEVFDKKTNIKRCCSVSRKIKNLHNAETGVLKIVNCSRTFGTCHGDDEVFIFVEKISKDVEVRFFNLNEGQKRIWQAPATYGPHNVHHQLGIIFRTPKYPVEINCDTKVFFELHRKNDGACSEPFTFTYKPHQDYKLHDGSMKRPHSPEIMSSEDEYLPSVVTSYKSKRSKDDFIYPDSTSSINQLIQAPNINLPENIIYEPASEPVEDYNYILLNDDLNEYDLKLESLCGTDGGDLLKLIDQSNLYEFDSVSSSDDPILKKDEEPIKFNGPAVTGEGEMPKPVVHSTTTGPDSSNTTSVTTTTIESRKGLKSVSKKLLHSMKLNLHSAISQRQSIQEISQILKHVENINEVDYDGNSALHYSAGLPEYLKILLLRKDIDRNIRNLCGDDVMLSATRNGYVPAMKLLLEENFDPNVHNSRSGETPLHIAVSDKNFHMVDLLLKHGADPLIDNHSGLSSYEYSLNCGTEIRQIMYISMQKSIFKKKSITSPAQPACSVADYELVGKLKELTVSSS